MNRHPGIARASFDRSLWTYTSTERSCSRSGCAPDRRVELLARDDPALPPGQRGEQLELPHRQRERASAREREVIRRPDLQIAGPEHLGFVCQLHRCERLAGAPPLPVTGR